MHSSSELPISEHLSDEALTKALEECVHEYSERIQRIVEEGGELFAPLSSNGVATATDVIIATRNMLKVFEIAPFELSMLAYGGLE